MQSIMLFDDVLIFCFDYVFVDVFFLHRSELISNFDGSLFSSFVAQQNMCMTHVS